MTRTMLGVNIDRTGPVPLHDQVAARIRRAIAEGEASPGERLPPAKDLAAVLGVNKTTVLRALHILRRRPAGVPARPRHHRRGHPQLGAVLARARDLLDFAGHHGFGRDDVIQIIQSLP